MKRPFSLLGALALLAASSSCAPVESSEPDVAESRAAIGQGTCGGARWVGVASSTCPTVPGWVEAQLFPGTSSPLDAYCVFDFAGPGAPTPNDIFTLLTSGPTLLAEDCPVVVPQQAVSNLALASAGSMAGGGMYVGGTYAGGTYAGAATTISLGTSTADAYEQELARSLRQSFQATAGTVAALELPRQKRVAPTRVVMIDTAPDELSGGPIHPGNDRHGDTLASIVGDIACDGSGCRVDVRSALGMPWLDSGTYTEAGGHVGRLSDLALAIRRAVETFSGERLVINLSLGWEDAPGLAECGAERGRHNGPARAVYDVIEDARCQGALIVAAAGNDAGSPSPPTGLICPARWEASSVSACGGDSNDPLLYAAGGVDYSGKPITATRPHGRPRINALALGGVAWQSADPIPPPLTGTSVSAAVTSAIAGVLWSYEPGLRATDVMNVLYASGAETGLADTCPAGTMGSCEARTVTLCEALRSAGVYGGPCTPAPHSMHSSPPLSPSVEGELAVILAATPPTPAAADPIVATTVIPHFHAPAPALGGGTFPEPVVPVCPSCNYSLASAGTNILYARPTVCITGAALVLESPLMRAATSLAISTPLSANTSYQFHITGAPAGVTRAWLTGYTDLSGATSVMQEIIVR